MHISRGPHAKGSTRFSPRESWRDWREIFLALLAKGDDDVVVLKGPFAGGQRSRKRRLWKLRRYSVPLAVIDGCISLEVEVAETDTQVTRQTHRNGWIE